MASALLLCLLTGCASRASGEYYYRNKSFEDYDISALGASHAGAVLTDIDTLIITAGFGRVALLEELTDTEVNNLFKVNCTSAIRILKKYFKFKEAILKMYARPLVIVQALLSVRFISLLKQSLLKTA